MPRPRSRLSLDAQRAGDAAAEILASVLGDETAFTTTSTTATNPYVETRSFHSFTQAADENGDSRVIVAFTSAPRRNWATHGREIAVRLPESLAR